MKKNIILALITLILIAFGIYFFLESKKEYIGGNVLNLTFITEYNNPKEGNIAPPWINTGFIYHLLFRPLVLANHDLSEFKPALAKSYSISEDGKIYKFVKNDNLKWSDGVEFSLDDIIFSIDTARSSNKVDPVYSEAFSYISDINSNDGVVTITLKEEFVGFLDAISQFLILPKHLLASDANNLSMSEFWDNPVGTGMYRLSEITDEYHKLTINPYYIGTKPKIEEILLHKKFSTNDDIYLASDVSDMINYRSMRGYAEYILPTKYYKYFVYNIEGVDGFTNPAMQDFRVRSAIAIAIDNHGIVNSIYMNNAEAFTVEGRQPYDPEKAKQHLKEANYDFNRPLRLAYYNTNTTFSFFLQSIVKNLEDVGFKVQLVKANSSDELIEKRNFDVMLKDSLVLQDKDWYFEITSNHSYSRILGSSETLDELVHNYRTAKGSKEIANTKSALSQAAGEHLLRYPLLNLNLARYIGPRLNLPNDIEFGSPWHILDFRFEEWEIKKQ